MKKRTMILTLAAGGLVLGLGFSFAQMGQGKGPGAGAGYARAQTRPLSEEAKNALLEALAGPEGEYAAYAVYTAVIEKYGAVEPYVSIREAEAKHIEALQRQLDRYGVDYPKTNPFLGKVEAPGDLAAFAQAGVEAEIANVSMYDRLMEAVADYPNLVQVFEHLRAASQERHLPAFELAAENGGSLSPGQMQQLHTQTGAAAGHGPRVGAGHGAGAAGQGHGPQQGRGHGQGHGGQGRGCHSRAGR